MNRRSPTTRRTRSARPGKARGGAGRRAKAPAPRSRRLLARVAVAVLLVGVVLLGPLLAWSFLPASEASGERVSFVVADAKRSEVVLQLVEHGLVDSEAIMNVYLAFLAPGVEFRPRAHLLERGLSPRELVQSLGEIGRTKSARLAIPEGFHRFQIARRLEDSGICSRVAFLASTTNRSLLEQHGLRAPSAEGFLFPATYEFHLDEDPDRVVGRLVQEALKRFQKVEASLSGTAPELAGLGLGRVDVVNLASIIEKESASQTERPRIARVFLNRLLDGDGGTKGRLQSDPTALYGCRVLDSAPSGCPRELDVPTPSMLRDGSNPYNTYRVAGLPPGPIANPGEDSYRAVLAPADGDWLYFVADGSGKHAFSETYEQHREAVTRLRRLRGPSP